VVLSGSGRFWPSGLSGIRQTTPARPLGRSHRPNESAELLSIRHSTADHTATFQMMSRARSEDRHSAQSQAVDRHLEDAGSLETHAKSELVSDQY
jgi:hypothetical protein